MPGSIRCLFHVLASVALLSLALVFVGATTASAGGTWSAPSHIANSNSLGISGTLYAWGWNNYGQLGDGTTTEHNSPEAITLAPGVTPTAISAGLFHSLAIGSNRQLYAWGANNFFGELGDGTTTEHNSPEAITLAPGVTPIAISAGGYYSLAIGSNRQLYAWGANVDGLLGDGTTTDHYTPEAITLAAPGVTPIAISAGGDNSLAIGSNRKLYAWGSNALGELGDGTTTEHNSPEAITLAPGVTPTAISAGLNYSLAIGSNGKLYAWGYNDYGQLGDGTPTDHYTPEAITLAPGVTPIAISASGSLHSLAIGSNRKLYAWGHNVDGELGDGTTTDHYTPEAITLAPGVTPIAISVGGDYSLTIGSNGKLYAWGVNQDGQLGDGTTTEHNSPEAITLAPGVTPTAISASNGGWHSLAIGWQHLR